MVIGQRGHARAQPDAPRALSGRGDEYLRRGDGLVARRVVLADPGLVIAQLVEVLDELEIALEGKGGILVDGMKRRQEDSEAQRRIQH